SGSPQLVRHASRETSLRSGFNRAVRRSGGRAVRECLSAVLLLSAGPAVRLTAQGGGGVDGMALRFASMTAVTGFEQAMGDSLLALLPGSSRDRLGNVTLALGHGAPRRLATCGLDEAGYVVGGITDGGYLTLRRAAGAAVAAAVAGQPRVQGTVVVAVTVQSLYGANAGLSTVRALQGPFAEIKQASLTARYPDTAVETVALAQADSLAHALVTWMEGR